MNNNNTLIGIVIALVVGGAVGYLGAGYQYSAQLAKARAAFPTQPTMFTVSGVIESISGNTLTMKTQSSMNPFETIPTVRTVTVTDATKIVRTELKDPKVYQQELAAYQKAMQKRTSVVSSTTPTASNLPTPPTPFIETVLKVADLNVGDQLIADAGKDIKMQTSFEAVKITVIDTVFTPLPVGAGGGTSPASSTGGTVPINTLPPTPAIPSTIKTGAVPVVTPPPAP